MADITLDGLDFDVADFVGEDGLGHVQVLPATTGASGAAYPAEARFPNRVFRAALNQLGQGLYSTSTSSVAIGTGSKSFTLATSVQITDGAFVLVTDQTNDANYMYGQVTSVVGLVYTVNVTATGGSGTIAAWNFQVSGVRGVDGTVADGDKGDITVSSGGTVWTIDNDAVTTAKILNGNVTVAKLAGGDLTGKGYSSTSYDAGTKSSGTFTPDAANGNLQRAVNGGAHTLAPPSTDTTLIVQYTNNGSAGAITTSGFTKVDGSFTTTNGDDFLCYIARVNSFTHLNIVAMQ